MASITFPEMHSEVGAVVIQEHGPELIVRLGRFTHSHFGNYDQNLSSVEAAERVSENVVVFLERLFSDQIVLWGSRSEGGFYTRSDPPAGPPPPHGPRCVWSGPILDEE